MKKLQIAAFLLLIIAFFACKKAKDSSDVLTNGSEATLALEDCATFQDFDNLKVCLKEINDGICPCNRDCIWEGVLNVNLHLTKTGLDSTVNLYSKYFQAMNLDTSIVIGNETIILKSVNVDDFCTNQGKYEKYTVGIEVKN
jgi:hypothetical protein